MNRSRVLYSFLSWITLTAGACVMDEELAQTESPVLNSGRTISSGGKCLDTYYSNGESGTASMMWSCHEQGQQLWSVTPDGLVRSASGRCLDASSDAENAYLLIWDCHGGNNQKWLFEKNPARAGAFRIRGVASGKCATRGGNGDGEGVFIRTCNGSDEQDWYTTTWGSVANARYPNECWDWIEVVPGSGSFDNNKFRLGTRSCGGSMFEFENNGGPIHFYDPALCVEAASSAFDGSYVPDRAKIWAKTCTGYSNQRWTWDNGFIKTINNRCITRMWTSSGVELQAQTCAGLDVQRWWSRNTL